MRVDLEAYFQRPDTPMAGSPIGEVMQELLEHYPQLTPEQAHKMVKQQFERGERTFRAKAYANLVSKMAVTPS